MNSGTPGQPNSMAPDTLGSNSMFRTNRQTIQFSVEIPSHLNAATVGPITIESGQTVTVANGATWAIL